MDDVDLNKLLDTPEDFAALCDRENWLSDSKNEVTIAKFMEEGLPDPAMVRAWWQGKADLPGTDNYVLWQKSGDLVYEHVQAEGDFSGHLKERMIALAMRISVSTTDDAPEAEPASGAIDQPDDPAPEVVAPQVASETTEAPTGEAPTSPEEEKSAE